MDNIHVDFLILAELKRIGNILESICLNNNEGKNHHDKNNKNLLSRKEAAEFLGTTEGTLAIWACNKRYGLPLVKIGRLAKYRLSDLEAFIEKRMVNNNATS